MVHLARGAAALGEGRNDDAFRHLWPVFDEDSGLFHRFVRWNATLDIAEAAAKASMAAAGVAALEKASVNLPPGPQREAGTQRVSSP